MHDLLKIQNQCYKAYQKKHSMERTTPHDTSMQTMSFSDCSCSRWQYQASFYVSKNGRFFTFNPRDLSRALGRHHRHAHRLSHTRGLQAGIAPYAHHTALSR